MTGCFFIAAMLTLGVASAETVLTKEMEDIFLRLEKPIRESRAKITSARNSILKTSLPYKVGGELSIITHRHASMSSIKIAKLTEVQRKWKKLKLTYKLHGLPRSLSNLETRRIFYKACRTWSRHSQLQFKEVNDVMADINIRFVSGNHGDGDGNAFDGPGGHLAHALPPPSGELHIDVDDFWSKRYSGKQHVIVTPHGKRRLEIRTYYSLLRVAVHEIGHVLGLPHTDVKESIMFPLYGQKSSKGGIKLDVTDVKAIQALYGVYNSTAVAHGEDRPGFLNTKKKKNSKPPPDPCKSSVDAAYSDGNKIHFFKDRYYWTWNGNTKTLSTPQKIKTKFDLSKPKVSAACHSNFSGRTYIFSGHKYWRYHGDILENGYPRLSSGHGLPTNPAVAIHIQDTEKIIILKRKKIYIFDELDEKAIKLTKLQPLDDANVQHRTKLINRGKIRKNLSPFLDNHGLPPDSVISFDNAIYIFRNSNICVSTSFNLWTILDSFLPDFASVNLRRQDVPWLRNCFLK